mgnify:CR=1 FL=1
MVWILAASVSPVVFQQPSLVRLLLGTLVDCLYLLWCGVCKQWVLNQCALVWVLLCGSCVDCQWVLVWVFGVGVVSCETVWGLCWSLQWFGVVWSCGTWLLTLRCVASKFFLPLWVRAWLGVCWAVESGVEVVGLVVGVVVVDVVMVYNGVFVFPGYWHLKIVRQCIYRHNSSRKYFCILLSSTTA